MALQLAVKSGSDLRDSDLTPIRDDLWAVLSSAPSEVEGLRQAIIDGKINGSTYTGACACLVGTIANVRGTDHHHLGALKPNSGRPAERFFLGIVEGDTPDKSQVAQKALEWIDEWLFNMKSSFGTQDVKK